MSSTSTSSSLSTSKRDAILTEGFPEALNDSGQTRRNFWIADPETYEVVGVSFFAQGHQPDDWHDSDHRRKARERFEPLLLSSTVVKHYKVVGHHRAN